MFIQRNSRTIFKTSFLLLLTLSIGCSKLFYFPDSYIYSSPESNGFKKTDIIFEASDQTKLHGWFFPNQNGKKAKGTIVQFHGNAQNISSHYASTVWMSKRGYQLFTFDYRGYGVSAGRPTQQGTNRDALAALAKGYQLHQEFAEKNAPFVVLGQSLGGAILMRALKDSEVKDKVNLLVLDSTFTSYKDVAQEKLASIWLTWLFSPLGQVLVSDEYSSTLALKENKIQTLVIHDIKDHVIGFQNGLEIYQQLSCKKEFWVQDNGFHIGIFSMQSIEYRDRFIEMLDHLNKK